MDFVENLEMTQIAGGKEGREVMFFVSFWGNACKNWYVIHPWNNPLFTI